MNGLSAEIDEQRGMPFRARSLYEAFARRRDLLPAVAETAAVVRECFLCGPEWSCRIHEGSLTFINRSGGMAIKVLVDLDNLLAVRAGLTIEEDPLVVGVELTHINPFLRFLIRQYLRQTFGERYLDPHGPRPDSLAIVTNTKIWFVPHRERLYDILFVPLSERLPVEKVKHAVVRLFEERLRAQFTTGNGRQLRENGHGFLPE